MRTALLVICLLFSVSACQQSTNVSGSSLSSIGLSVTNSPKGVTITEYTLTINTDSTNTNGAVVIDDKTQPTVTKTAKYGEKLNNIKLKATGKYTLELSLKCKRNNEEEPKECYKTREPYEIDTAGKGGKVIKTDGTDGNKKLILTSVNNTSGNNSTPDVENVPPQQNDNTNTQTPESSSDDFDITVSASIVESGTGTTTDKPIIKD